MKVSIITVVYNGADTIECAIKSVLSQTYKDIEYIIIDGLSTDNTMQIVKKYEKNIAKVISESDKGLYDAMNKGIKLASGDVIGILNSDDFYMNEFVISDIVKEFKRVKKDIVYADLVYAKPDDLQKVVRYYDSGYFAPKKLAYGWMPAHPTLFVKKSIYEKYGAYKIDYKIAADYEIVVRFLSKYNLSYSYLKKAIVKMRVGGISTRGLKSFYVLNKEIIRACRENEVYTNWFMVLLKYPQKILGLLKKNV